MRCSWLPGVSWPEALFGSPARRAGDNDEGITRLSTDAATDVSPAPAGARARRRWVGVIVWLFAALFAGWAVARLVPGDVHFRWVQLVAFTPYVAAASVVAPLLALASRRWTALVVSLVVTGTLTACVLPRALAGGDPPATGPKLRVLAANLAVGAVPPPVLVELVRSLRPDVLMLQELTPSAAEGLDKAGLGGLLPYRMDRSREGVGGSGIYARFPVTPGRTIDFGGFGQASATVAVPSAPPVDIVSVHPCAPRYEEKLQCWADGLAALPLPGGPSPTSGGPVSGPSVPGDTRPGGPVRILGGDFNATLDHARIRRLLDAGYRDAADATGDGLTTTWPYKPWHFNGLSIPTVTLDHVLVDPRVAVHSFSVHQLPRTDHRAVFAQLTLPAR